MANELDLVEDVRSYILDQLGEYDAEEFKKIHGSEIEWDVMSEANANGTITFSRVDARDLLKAHPGFTDDIIKKMIDDLGYDWEDIYENGEDYDDYIEHEAEKVQVILYIELAGCFFAECPTVMKYWNEPIGNAGDNALEIVKDEIRNVSARNVGI